MFWKVPGFSQPSPVERVLDKEEFTLEDLLDEDDLIQELKSLNGRLVAFLREPSSVEQLVRYMVEPQDPDDAKKTFKYPFAACEVLCCEVEAVFNTLLEEAGSMNLLFSLLDSTAPLNSKAAGYFGRVVGSLLMRKGIEMLQYFQQQGDALLEKLVMHVDTTSVADVVKRMVGADDGASVMPLPAMAQWLSETPLISLLLSRLSSSHSTETQGNAADILAATAHSQPSPLAFKLAEHACVNTLMEHALAPGRRVLVPALSVCVALLEPQRPMIGVAADASSLDLEQQDSVIRAKNEAAAAIVLHLQPLVDMLYVEKGSESILEVPYGLLSPPLGLNRLKVVQLLAVLARCGCMAITEEPIVRSLALPKCLGLFLAFPFNNLLHHSVASMLISCITSTSDAMLQHLFLDCGLLDWIVQLPQSIVPTPHPGRQLQAAAKTPLRAGYLGHITHVAGALDSLSRQRPPNDAPGSEAGTSGREEVTSSKVSEYTKDHEGWIKYVEEVLHPQQELENTSGWACGRPAPMAMVGLDSEDEFQRELELEQITGLQQPLYHRYSSEENEDDDDEGIGAGSHADYKASNYDFATDLISDGMSGMDLQGSYLTSYKDEDPYGSEEASGSPIRNHPPALNRPLPLGVDDDEVLLASSDDESSDSALSSPDRKQTAAAAGGGGIGSHRLSDAEGGAHGFEPDDVVIVNEASDGEKASGGPEGGQPPPPTGAGDKGESRSQ